MNLNVQAQEYYDAANSPRQYYYNNLESATAGSPATYFASGGSTRTSAFIDIVSSSSLNSSKSLSTTGSNTIGNLAWNFLANSSTGTNTSLASAAWEWEFDYKNTTGGATGDCKWTMAAGSDSWRYYLLATTYTADSWDGNSNNPNPYTVGLYLTHYNGNLILRYKYGSYPNQFTDYATMSMPNNTNTYQIRVERQGPNGYYKIFILNRTTGVTTISSDINIGSGPGTAYNLSFLQASSSTANRFQFDNFNFYKVKLEYIPITTSPAGLSSAIYPGMSNAIPFAVNVNVRGDVYFGRFVIKYAGDASKLFSAGSLYKKAINQTLSLTSATLLGNFSLNSDKTNQLDIPASEYYYSAGGTDGSAVNVINYFFYTTVKNPFDGSYPTSVTYSVSNDANDTYNQFYQSDTGPYNSASSVSTASAVNGDVYDWTGTYTSWTTSGSWTKNGAASTSNPSTSTDIARIGVVAYTGVNQPDLPTSTTVGKLIFGSNNTPTITMSNNRILTASAGVDLLSGATVSLTGAGKTTALATSSGSSSSIPSGASLSIVNRADLTNGGSFSLAGTLNLDDNVTNSGAFTMSGSGAANLSGNFTNTSTGTFSATGGTVDFNASSTQVISNASSTAVAFYNLTVSNSTGSLRTKTFSNGNFSVAAGGKLTLSAKVVLAIDSLTNGLLTLKSNVTGTASVDAIPSTSSVTGSVAAERYVTGGTLAYRGYRLFSSPVYEGTAGGNNVYGVAYTKKGAYLTGTTGTAGGFDATSASNPTIYLYREDKTASQLPTAGNFRGINKINNATTYNLNLDNETGTYNIPVGNGFMFFFRGNRATNASTSTSVIPDAVTFSNTGKLNQQNIIVKLWYTGSSTLGKTNTRYNLVGNPYASTIDWNTFSSTASSNAIYGPNLSNTIYIYNPTSKNYATYVAGTASGIGTNGGTRYIPSGQGFYVYANANGIATLTFTEAAKVASQQVITSNLLMARAPVAEEVIPQYIKLELKKDDISKEDMVVRFNKSATSDYLFNEDSQYFQGSGAVNLYSKSADNVNLAINQVPFSSKSQTIRLYAGVIATGTYQFTVTTMQDIPEMFDIWLMDAFTGDSVNVKLNATYSFNANTSNPATFGANRFSLVIRPNAAKSYHLLSFTSVRTKTNVKLTWTTENEKDYTFFTLERSTNGGQSFEIVKNIKSSDLSTYNFLDKTPATGENLYRLKQEDYFGTISYSETLTVIFTSADDGPVASVVVFPNPVSSTMNVSIVQTNKTKSANFTIDISNSTGRVVKTVTSSQTEWQGNVADLLPGTYFLKVTDANTKKKVGSSTFVKL